MHLNLHKVKTRINNSSKDKREHKGSLIFKSTQWRRKINEYVRFILCRTYFYAFSRYQTFVKKICLFLVIKLLWKALVYTTMMWFDVWMSTQQSIWMKNNCVLVGDVSSKNIDINILGHITTIHLRFCYNNNNSKNILMHITTSKITWHLT